MIRTTRFLEPKCLVLICLAFLFNSCLQWCFSGSSPSMEVRLAVLNFSESLLLACLLKTLALNTCRVAAPGLNKVMWHMRKNGLGK